MSDLNLKYTSVVAEKQKSRLTTVYYVYHEQPGEEPRAVQNAYSQILKYTLDPLSFKLQVGPEWQLVFKRFDVSEYSLVTMLNVRPFLAVFPTEDEQKRLDSLFFELKYASQPDDGVFDLILPGEMVVKRSSLLSSLMIRCPNGTAACKVVAISG